MELQTCQAAIEEFTSELTGVRGVDACTSYQSSKSQDDLLECLAANDAYALPYPKFDKFIETFEDLNTSGNVQMYIHDPFRAADASTYGQKWQNRHMATPTEYQNYDQFLQNAQAVASDAVERAKIMVPGQYMAAIESKSGSPATQVVDFAYWPATSDYVDASGKAHDAGS